MSAPLRQKRERRFRRVVTGDRIPPTIYLTHNGYFTTTDRFKTLLEAARDEPGLTTGTFLFFGRREIPKGHEAESVASLLADVSWVPMTFWHLAEVMKTEHFPEHRDGDLPLGPVIVCPLQAGLITVCYTCGTWYLDVVTEECTALSPRTHIIYAKPDG